MRYSVAHLAAVVFAKPQLQRSAAAAKQQSFLQVLALSASDLHECPQRNAATTLAAGDFVPDMIAHVDWLRRVLAST